MATLRIEKVLNSLPGVLTGDTLYFVLLANGTIEQYVTDAAGSTAHLTSGSASSRNAVDPFLLMGVTSG